MGRSRQVRAKVATTRRGVGARFADLVALQARLRGPGGCPWDREQTHQSLRTYLVEETYEVLDAVEKGDYKKFAEELGDLLLQVVFHAQMAREAGRFDIGDVIEHIYTKLVRRHPHVFGAAAGGAAGRSRRVRRGSLKTGAEVLKKWEELKAEERQLVLEQGQTGNDSILAGVPRTLPALLEAYQLTRRAAHVGFDWENIEGLLEKLREETDELRQTLPRGEVKRLEEEVGDLLFVAVNVARFLGVDPEIALKKANRKFVKRFQQMEREMGRQGRRLAEASMDEMEQLWEQSKRRHTSGTKSRAGKK